MLEVSAVGWALTVGLVLALLLVDLVLAVARPHEVGFREATAVPAASPSSAKCVLPAPPRARAASSASS